MTIASEIQRIKDNIADAYTSCQSKGATMPATQNSDNLADCIDSISGGGGSTLITKTITQNGTYNASSDNADGYSSVTVNVSGGSFTGVNREVVNGVYVAPTTSFTWSLPNTATDIGAFMLQQSFRNSTGLTSIDISSLTSLNNNYSMQATFLGCTNLTGVIDLSNLTIISGQYALAETFVNCTGLTDVDLSSLTTISGKCCMQYSFRNCTSLTDVDLSSLTTISRLYKFNKY